MCRRKRDLVACTMAEVVLHSRETGRTEIAKRVVIRALRGNLLGIGVIGESRLKGRLDDGSLELEVTGTDA